MKEIYGIIGAMDPEVQALKDAMTKKETKVYAEMEFVSGTIGTQDVVVVKCGMGKVNAGMCAFTLIHLFHVTKIINTGVAGSLNNDLNIGDIVVSKEALQHDFDVSPIGFQRGEIPYTGKVLFPADETLMNLVLKIAKEVVPEIQAIPGRICSGDQFIASRTQKQQILDTFGGDCCEMEGAAIAQVCYLNQIPFVIIRAISDKADDSEEVSFETFAASAAQHSIQIIMHLLQA